MAQRRPRNTEPPKLHPGRGAALGGFIVLPSLILLGFFVQSQMATSKSLMTARRTMAEIDAKKRETLRNEGERQSELLARLFELQRSEDAVAAELRRTVPTLTNLDSGAARLSDTESEKLQSLLAMLPPLREERALLSDALVANPPAPEPVVFALAEGIYPLLAGTTTDSLGSALGRLNAGVAAAPKDPALRRALGVALARSGDMDGAVRVLAEATTLASDAYGPRSTEAANAMLLQAEAMRRQGADRREVTTMIERALAILEPDWTRQSLAISRRYEDLGILDRAVDYSSPTLSLAMARGGDSDLLTADGSETLARQLQAQGKFSDAEPLLRRALAIRERVLGPDDPRVADSILKLATLLGAQNRAADAERFFRRAIAVQEKAFGPDSAEVADTLYQFGEFKRTTASFSEAQTLQKRAYDIRVALYGEDDLRVSDSIAALAALAASEDQVADAEALFRRALMIREKALGENAPEVLELVNPLASMLLRQGRAEEAEPWLRRQLSAEEIIYGAEDPRLVSKLTAIADICLRQERVGEAGPFFERAITIIEKSQGRESTELAGLLNNLGFVYHVEGRTRQAGELWKRALDIRRKALGDNHPDLAVSYNNLGFLYAGEGEIEEASLFYLGALDLQRSALGDGHPNNPATVMQFYEALAPRVKTAEQARNLLRLANFVDLLTVVPDTISREEVRSIYVALDRNRVDAVMMLDPPRRDLASRVVLRLAVYAKLLDMPSKDPFRVDFLDKRISILGIGKQVEELEKKVGVTRAQAWSDPMYTVGTARLAAYVDGLVPPVKWKEDMPEMPGGWELGSLEPRGENLRRRLADELRKLDATPTPTPTPGPPASPTPTFAPLLAPKPTAVPPPTPFPTLAPTPTPASKKSIFDEG
jgi:tetratricopeptide (TPR) repeat protein